MKHKSKGRVRAKKELMEASKPATMGRKIFRTHE
jgi:hypothetical protein